MGSGWKRAIAAAKATQKTKLTGPQRALLSAIALQTRYVSDRYAPAIRLVAMGLAVWRNDSYSTTLQITRAGREALT